MKIQFAVLSTLFFLSGCSGSADKKVPELANEMCGCFTSFDKTLSPAGKELMKAVSLSDNPQTALMTGMSKLKPEEAAAFAEKMKSLATKGTEVYNCMEAFDKKHSKETTKDKSALTESLLKQIKKQGDCPTGAAMINLSLASGKIK